MTSVFSWQNSVSLCPFSFCIPRPNFTLYSQVFFQDQFFSDNFLSTLHPVWQFSKGSCEDDAMIQNHVLSEMTEGNETQRRTHGDQYSCVQLKGCHCDYISSEKHKDIELGPGRNNAGQRLTEFCQQNTLVIANTLFQQHKKRLYTRTSPDGQSILKSD